MRVQSRITRLHELNERIRSAQEEEETQPSVTLPEPEVLTVIPNIGTAVTR